MSRRESSGIEWTVALPALALSTIGVLFVYSATSDWAVSLWPRQVLFVLAGLAVAPILSRFGPGFLAGFSVPSYLAVLGVLIAMPLLAEPSTAGSDRWIRLPLGFKLQPSEFMKIGLVLALARHLQHRGITNTWRSYIAPLAITVVPWFFVMRQPDLGSSLVLLPVFVSMVVVSGARLAHIVLVATSVALIVPAAYFLPGVLEPYQKDRIDAYLRPIDVMLVEARELRQARQHDEARETERQIRELKRGTGRQQFFSVVAIGSGGLTGAGLTEGIQNNSNLLPAQQTDFIFAVIGEEWGLVGTTTVVLLYACLIAAILGVGYRTREPFGRLVCVGVGALIGGQALMHLGINTGLLPVTGLTLPFVSYGGSSILSTWLGVAIVLDVARRRPVVFFEQ